MNESPIHEQPLSLAEERRLSRERRAARDEKYRAAFGVEYARPTTWVFLCGSASSKPSRWDDE